MSGEALGEANGTLTHPIQDGRPTEPSVWSQKAEDSDDGSIDRRSGPSKRKQISGFASRTKAKTKELLKIDVATRADEQQNGENGGIMDNIEQDPAFNPSQLTKKKQKSLSPMGAATKTKEALQTIGTAFAHPKQAIKSKATRTTAGQLSKAERPYLSQKNDAEFLEAHDNLERAESTSSSQRGSSDEEQEMILDSHRDKIREMEAHRESLRAAWTTRRHVRRVRVVPKRHMTFPDDEFFVERDSSGNFVCYDWLSWLGYNLIYYTQDFSAQYIDDFDELPFDIDSSRHYIERLVMSSAPWQSWAMKVRAVYRWEDPKMTAKWFALYVVLWYTRHIMGFLYFYIIYIVLKNGLYPTSVGSLRDSMKRALDDRGKAYKFGELIDKHGRHDWLEPVMEDLGPFIQLQLGDMANMLEVFSNFYYWKSPRKTVASLCFFVSCLAVSLFASMDFCMQIFWFIAGGSFFLCWPISSRYPKYRYLVSPFKWVLWDIPTHAEWSFQYLRRQAQLTREHLIEQRIEDGHFREVANPATDKYTGRLITIPKIQIEGNLREYDDGSSDDGWHSASSTTSALEATDLRSFRAFCEGSVGRLVIYSKGIRFVRSLSKKEPWRYDFLELAEMRKIKGSTLSKIVASPDQLEIKCIDKRIINLEGMKERDEAFNTIIGFSGLQWQSLQIKQDTNAQESTGYSI